MEPKSKNNTLRVVHKASKNIEDKTVIKELGKIFVTNYWNRVNKKKSK
jgi:hypothetical protein